MRLIAGSILVGFTLLAKVFGGFGGSTRFGPALGGEGRDWSISIYVPTGLEILIWLFMLVGIGLMVWELIDIFKARKKGT